MRGTLSQSSSQNEDREPLPDKINQNDPKHLRKVINNLLDKSKSIISTLEGTVSKLEKTERERDYWKKNYLQFREACLQYVQAGQLDHFMDLVKKDDHLKDTRIFQECEAEQFKSKASVILTTAEKRKKRMNKSISTVTFTRESPVSQHRLGPKKIDILGRRPQKSRIEQSK